MNVASIITQVNDPTVVAVDIDTFEIKADDSNDKSKSDIIVAANHGVNAFGDATENTAGAPAAGDAAAAAAACPDPQGQRAAAAPATKPRSRLCGLCCCCFGASDSSGEGRRRRRRRKQQGQNGCQSASAAGPPAELLGPRDAALGDRICAVIDLDETLVHSSFKFVEEPDFTIDVEIEGLVHQVYVLKRPHVDEFLERMGQLFECVLFTASLAKYADPVSDRLDKWSAFKYRLFREACVLHGDNFVKDLAQLGRPVDRCLIIDNSPASYMFNKENAIQVRTWIGDPTDRELLDLLPYLERLAASASVPDFLRDCPPPQPQLPQPQILEGDVGAADGDKADVVVDGDAGVDVEAVELSELHQPEESR